MRKIIDENLNLNLQITLANCIKNETEINSFPIIFTFGTTHVESEDKYELTENMIYMDKTSSPYFIVLNDMFIQLFQKTKQIKRSKQYFLGIDDLIDKKEHVNVGEKKFKIGILEDAKRKGIVMNLAKLMANRILEYWMRFFCDTYKSILGEEPTTELCQQAVLAITDSDVSLSGPYSTKSLISEFAKIIYFKIKT